MSTNLNVQGIWVGTEYILMFSSTENGKGRVVGGSWGSSGEIILKDGTNNTFILKGIGGQIVFDGDTVGSKATWNRNIIFVCSSKIIPISLAVENDEYCNSINNNTKWICDAENFEKKCPKKSIVNGWTKNSADILISHPVVMPLSVVFRQSQNLCSYIKADLQPKPLEGQKILDVKGVWVGIEYILMFSSTENGLGKVVGGSWGSSGGIILKDGTNNTFFLTDIGGSEIVFEGDSVGSKATWNRDILVCSSKIIPDTSLEVEVENDEYCNSIDSSAKWICDAENFEKKCPKKSIVNGWTKNSADVLILHPIDIPSIQNLKTQNLCPYKPPEKKSDPENPPEKTSDPEKPPEKTSDPENPPEKTSDPEKPPEKTSDPEKPPEKKSDTENPSEKKSDTKNPSEKKSDTENPPEKSDTLKYILIAIGIILLICIIGVIIFYLRKKKTKQ